MKILILLFVVMTCVVVNAGSLSDQIITQSATYRRQQRSYPGKPKVGSTSTTALEEALLLAAKDREYEHPVNAFVERQLSAEYSTCAEALGDIVSWCLVLYGDWNGNKAGNIVGYYMYALATDKVPKWVKICAQTS